MTPDGKDDEGLDAYRAYAAPAPVASEAEREGPAVEERPAPVTVPGWIVVLALVGLFAAMALCLNLVSAYRT